MTDERDGRETVSPGHFKTITLKQQLTMFANIPAESSRQVCRAPPSFEKQAGAQALPCFEEPLTGDSFFI